MQAIDHLGRPTFYPRSRNSQPRNYSKKRQKGRKAPLLLFVNRVTFPVQPPGAAYASVNLLNCYLWSSIVITFWELASQPSKLFSLQSTCNSNWYRIIGRETSCCWVGLHHTRDHRASTFHYKSIKEIHRGGTTVKAPSNTETSRLDPFLRQ